MWTLFISNQRLLQLGWCNFGLALVIALKERPSSKLEDTMSAPEEGYKVVEYLVARHELLGQLTAYMFFLVCIKVIKYTDLNKSMTIIYLSVGRVKTRRNSRYINYKSFK
jgi:hypothetical protein